MSIESVTRTSPEMPARSAGTVAVVLNWNGWPDTIECLESLFRSDRPASQIVVVDNGSRDHSLDRLREWAEGSLAEKRAPRAAFPVHGEAVTFPIPYVSFPTAESALSADPIPCEPLVFISAGENLGYAGGNNLGLRYALRTPGCDYIWLLNNDAVVSSVALRATLMVAAENPSIGIVGAKVLTYDDPSLVQAMGGGRIIPPLGYDSQNGSGTSADEIQAYPLLLDHVVGASLLVRARAVEDVGLMDEDYFLYREETDWCIRMRQRNWQLYFCENAIVWHKQGRSIGHKTPLHDYYAVRNMLFLLRKFHPAALPSAALVLFVRSVVPKIARLQFKRLSAVLRAFWDFFGGKRGRAHTDGELLANRELAR